MPLKAGLVSAIAAIVRTAEIMAGLTLVVGVLINFANVVGRYCLSAPIPWAEEVMVFLMIAGVFFAAGATTLKGAHIRMDLAVQVLPARLQVWLDLLAHLAFIAVASVLIWYASQVIGQLYDYDQRSEVIRIPVAYPHSVIPVGLFIMILAAIARMISGAMGTHTSELEAQVPKSGTPDKEG